MRYLVKEKAWGKLSNCTKWLVPSRVICGAKLVGEVNEKMSTLANYLNVEVAHVTYDNGKLDIQ